MKRILFSRQQRTKDIGAENNINDTQKTEKLFSLTETKLYEEVIITSSLKFGSIEAIDLSQIDRKVWQYECEHLEIYTYLFYSIRMLAST